MRRRVIIGCSILVLALGAGAVMQRRAITETMSDKRLLELQLTAHEVPEAPTVREADDSNNRELLRLRNEVRQLRGQKKELEKLQIENRRLLVEISTAQTQRNVQAVTPEQGFTIKSTWTYSGLASPETALQSFFSALRDSDVPNLLSCFTPETIAQMGLLDNKTGQVRPDMVEQLQAIGRIEGFRLSEPQYHSDSRVTVKVQAAADGVTIPFQLRRVGTEWKLHMAH